jgi:ATP-dependent DNA helicase RecG
MDRLRAGDAPNGIERTQVDVKEEPGRRGRNGVIQAGQPENEQAAAYLAGEMACLANTPGGGAIILGVADDGIRIGTSLDAEWLRHRIYELTDRRLTISIHETSLDHVRLLVLTAPQAFEPIRVNGRLRWRVADHCVEMDAASWHQETQRKARADWSADPSGHPLDAANPVAVEIARRYLRAAGDSEGRAASDLAEAPAPDLLRRIHVVTSDGQLTNAGALLFVGTPHVGLDYLRRDYPGGDSTARVRKTGPLLEQVAEVEAVIAAVNRVEHTGNGFAHGQRPAIPSLAIREAIVNGVVHRDWLSPQPTTVEHIESVATITSPGGFLGGVGPTNIITHPSAPRYRSLAAAVGALGLAEYEGIGVDRMVREMLALGHAAPEITEIAGPYVRVSLVGGKPKPAVVSLLADLEPAGARRNTNVLLLLHHLMRRGWMDVASAAPVLQRPATETDAAIAFLLQTRVDGAPMIEAVSGVPSTQPNAYRLTDAMRIRLSQHSVDWTDVGSREAALLDWARARGRISSAEVVGLTGLTPNHSAKLLSDMVKIGTLQPGRATRGGRGFFYVPTH